MKNLIKTTALLFTFSIFLFQSYFALAQAPKSVNYQAIARDNSGNIMANQSVSVGISILQGSAAGTSVCDETYAVTTNNFGLINIEIGTQNPTDFANIDWGASSYWVEVSLDGNVFGTSQLVSVPYALHAAVADSIAGGSPEYWTKIGNDVFLTDTLNNLGLGTQYPSAPLHIKALGTSHQNGIRLETSQGTGEDWYIYMPSSDNLQFRNDLAEYMTIEMNTGNVGIGIMDPVAKLDVDNSTEASTINVNNTRLASSNHGVKSTVEAPHDFQYAFHGTSTVNSDLNYWAYGARLYADANDHATGTLADAFGVYVYAYADDVAYGVRSYAYGDNTSYGLYAYSTSTAATTYAVYASGNLTCSGTKAATVRTVDGPKEVYSQESPEIWFEDFGSSSVINGQAFVNLQNDFVSTVTVNDQYPIKVFITPNSRLGDWWVEKNGTSFTLHAPDAADGSAFDYRIIAKRQGYEDYRMKDVPESYTDYNLYQNIEDVPEEYRQKWVENAPEEVQMQYPQYLKKDHFEQN